uniref:Putative HNH endonuclease n=1 Tax=viral metagenome TaxID=1070528 RepID=A0A6H1ZWW7_9ZZZZ
MIKKLTEEEKRMMKNKYKRERKKILRKDIHNYKICEKCGKPDIFHSKKGLCNNCYKKQWRKTNNKKICEGCGKLKFHHAKRLCESCYQKIFYPEGMELSAKISVEKNYNISYDLYKKITKRCIICGFDKVVHLHHLDETHKNNLTKNLVGLCPNHHRMIHMFKYKKSILNEINKKRGDTNE